MHKGREADMDREQAETPEEPNCGTRRGSQLVLGQKNSNPSHIQGHTLG